MTSSQVFLIAALASSILSLVQSSVVAPAVAPVAYTGFIPPNVPPFAYSVSNFARGLFGVAPPVVAADLPPAPVITRAVAPAVIPSPVQPLPHAVVPGPYAAAPALVPGAYAAAPHLVPGAYAAAPHLVPGPYAAAAPLLPAPAPLAARSIHAVAPGVVTHYGH